MNYWVGCGRLTKDPEIRVTQSGTKVAVYSLAIDRRRRPDGSDGGADFIPIKVFERKAEFAEKYLKKGMKMIVSGRIQTDSYTNRDGQRVYTTEIIGEDQEFAESKAASEQSAEKTVAQEANDGFLNIPDSVEDMGLPFN